MERLCTHPNVGAVLLVSLGCESFNEYRLEHTVRSSGRPAKTIVIQAAGGTRRWIAEGCAFVAGERAALGDRLARSAGRLDDDRLRRPAGSNDGVLRGGIC